MRLIVLLGILCCLNSHAQKAKPKLYTFSGTIMHTSEYCGGPAPSEELQEQIRTLTPYPGKVLFIKKGTVNNGKVKKLAVIHADSTGKFSLRLPPGKYCVIQEPQLRNLDLKGYARDKWLKVSSYECLKDWWRTCFYSFEIRSSDVKNVTLKYHQRCFLTDQNPCLEYIGPMPP